MRLSFLLSLLPAVASLNIATCSFDKVQTAIFQKTLNNDNVDIVVTEGRVQEEIAAFFQYTCAEKTVLSKKQAVSRECTVSTQTHAIHFPAFSLVIAPFQLSSDTSVSVPNVYTVKGPYVRLLHGVPASNNRRKLAELSGACKDLSLLWEPKYSFAESAGLTVSKEGDPVSKEGDRLRFLMLSNIDGFDLVPSELVNYHEDSDENGASVWDQVLKGFEEPQVDSFKTISISVTEKNTKADIEIGKSSTKGLCKIGIQRVKKEFEEEEKEADVAEGNEWISLKLANGLELQSWECNLARTNYRDPFSPKQFINLSAIIKVPESRELLHLYVTVHNPFTLRMSKYFVNQKYKSLTIVLPKTPEVAREVGHYHYTVINHHLPLLTPVSMPLSMTASSFKDEDFFVFALKNTWSQVSVRDEKLIQVSLTSTSNEQKRKNKVEIFKNNDSPAIYIFALILVATISAAAIFVFWYFNKK